MTTEIAVVQPERASLIHATAKRYNMDPTKVVTILRGTVFPEGTMEEMAAFLTVANAYDLNPFLRQIYAFPKKGGGIVPVVGVDGWVHLVNSHPMFNGMEFEHNKEHGSLISVTCRIYRKDRSLPVVVTEFLEECKRNTDPWKMPNRMLRHKALMQCARYAFGFSGIYDEDEAADIAYGRDAQRGHVGARVDSRPPAPPPLIEQETPQPPPPAQPATEVALAPPADPPAATHASLDEIREAIETSATLATLDEVLAHYDADMLALPGPDRDQLIYEAEELRARLEAEVAERTTSSTPVEAPAAKAEPRWPALPVPSIDRGHNSYEEGFAAAIAQAVSADQLREWWKDKEHQGARIRLRMGDQDKQDRIARITARIAEIEGRQ